MLVADTVMVTFTKVLSLMVRSMGTAFSSRGNFQHHWRMFTSDSGRLTRDMATESVTIFRKVTPDAFT